MSRQTVLLAVVLKLFVLLGLCPAEEPRRNPVQIANPDQDDIKIHGAIPGEWSEADPVYVDGTFYELTFKWNEDETSLKVFPGEFGEGPNYRLYYPRLRNKSQIPIFDGVFELSKIDRVNIRLVRQKSVEGPSGFPLVIPERGKLEWPLVGEITVERIGSANGPRAAITGRYSVPVPGEKKLLGQTVQLPNAKAGDVLDMGRKQYVVSRIVPLSGNRIGWVEITEKTEKPVGPKDKDKN